MTSPGYKSKVVVAGSLNVDYIANVHRLPMAGETVPASGLVRRFGGKGANQAVAAARQGASVSMIGCLGIDSEGSSYVERLRSEGIGVNGISTTSKALTGTALIAVDRAAENIIVVAAGANGYLKRGDVRARRESIASADALLLQMEVPLDSVIEAIRIANRASVPVVFNPSPWKRGFPWGEYNLDTLIVNAIEAEAIFGLRLESIFSNLTSWRRQLSNRCISQLIITRGGKSTLYVTEAAFGEGPTFCVKPVDTVGAGDAFAGTFAARRAEGMEVESAIEHANCAGALATLKAGAQEAIPTLVETEQALQKLSRRNGKANHILQFRQRKTAVRIQD
jgi:ribokinase